VLKHEYNNRGLHRIKYVGHTTEQNYPHTQLGEMTNYTSPAFIEVDDIHYVVFTPYYFTDEGPGLLADTIYQLTPINQ
jgi:hypothetical protein